MPSFIYTLAAEGFPAPADQERTCLAWLESHESPAWRETFLDHARSRWQPLHKRTDGDRMFRVASEGDLILCAHLGAFCCGWEDLEVTLDILRRRPVGVRILDFAGYEVDPENSFGRALLVIGRAGGAINPPVKPRRKW